MRARIVLSTHGYDTQTLAVATSPNWWAATRNISLEMVEAALQMAGVFTTAPRRCSLQDEASPSLSRHHGAVISAVLLVGAFFTQRIGSALPRLGVRARLDSSSQPGGGTRMDPSSLSPLA